MMLHHIQPSSPYQRSRQSHTPVRLRKTLHVKPSLRTGYPADGPHPQMDSTEKLRSVHIGPLATGHTSAHQHKTRHWRRPRSKQRRTRDAGRGRRTRLGSIQRLASGTHIPGVQVGKENTEGCSRWWLEAVDV